MTLADVGTWLMLAGAVLVGISALGLLRLPDFYARLSALTTAGGLAFVFILLGLLLHFPTPSNALKVLLALLIQLVTAATGGNALARAGYLVGIARTPATQFDDLAVAEIEHPDDEYIIEEAVADPGSRDLPGMTHDS